MRETKLWFLHIITAVVILFLLGSHIGIMHMGSILSHLGFNFSDHPTNSVEVFERSRQVLFMIVYIALLGTALFHGLYGLRSIFYELSLPKALEKTIGRVLCVAGIALFLYGSYVAVLLVRKGV
jgi:succinate dehydrogenase / fumarate reductase membrane anchor subunit